MKKLPYALLVVVMALIALNIATLRQLSRLETRVNTLEVAAAKSHATTSAPK